MGYVYEPGTVIQWTLTLSEGEIHPAFAASSKAFQDQRFKSYGRRKPLGNNVTPLDYISAVLVTNFPQIITTEPIIFFFTPTKPISNIDHKRFCWWRHKLNFFGRFWIANDQLRGLYGMPCSSGDQYIYKGQAAMVFIMMTVDWPCRPPLHACLVRAGRRLLRPDLAPHRAKPPAGHHHRLLAILSPNTSPVERNKNMQISLFYFSMILSYETRKIKCWRIYGVITRQPLNAVKPNK